MRTASRAPIEAAKARKLTFLDRLVFFAASKVIRSLGPDFCRGQEQSLREPTRKVMAEFLRWLEARA